MSTNTQKSEQIINGDQPPELAITPTTQGSSSQTHSQTPSTASSLPTTIDSPTFGEPCTRVNARCSCGCDNHYPKHLFLSAKTIWNCWACDACSALHYINQWDVPGAGENITCPRGIKRYRQWVYGSQGRVDYRHNTLDHRHVQLALKYVRTPNPRSRGYLRALLKPQPPRPYKPHNGFRGDDTWDEPSFSEFFDVTYSTRPKIVNMAVPHNGTPELRYILKSKWRYKYNAAFLNKFYAIDRPSFGDLTICPHVEMYDHSDYNLPYHLQDGSHSRVLDEAVCEAFETAFISGGNTAVEKQGVCTMCRTDISVVATRSFLEICAWQDLGGECDSDDAAWRTTVAGPTHFYREEYYPESERGRVRSAYEAPQADGLGRPGWWHLRSRVRRFMADVPRVSRVERDGDSECGGGVGIKARLRAAMAVVGRLVGRLMGKVKKGVFG